MGIITRVYSEVSGTIAHASSVNKVIDDLYTLQNGNINSANLTTSAVDSININASAILATKIANSAVLTIAFGQSAVDSSAIGNTAILSRMINNTAIGISQTDESIYLGAQVFNG